MKSVVASLAGYKSAFILSTVYFVAMMDRQVLAILFDPIKADLNLTDSQLALLSGLAFSLFYSIAGIPLGRLADRTHRVNMLSICLVAWSICTAAGGLALNYISLLLARIGVGVGEGGCTPAAHSILSDTYPPEQRSRAIAIYTFGGTLGAATAYLVGGWLVELFGWRITMICVAAPGVLLAIVLKLMLKEPHRPEIASDDSEQPSTVVVIKELLRQRVYLLTVAGHVLAIGYLFVVSTWLPAYINRNFDLSYGEIGTFLFGITLTGALVGNICSGILTDMLFAKNPRWLAYLPCIAMLMAGPLAIAAFSTSSMVYLFILLALTKAVLYANVAPSYAVVHYVVSARRRGVAVALKILMISIIGVGIFPVIVGLISDILSARYGDDALRYGVIAFAMLLSNILCNVSVYGAVDPGTIGRRTFCTRVMLGQFGVRPIH